MALKVIDLYCGAGGLSEGFSQMGFDIIIAIDNWRPACETFQYNHPGTEVMRRNILEIDASNLPYADVIIGGPPCKQFSLSNKGGRGDINSGMEQVRHFLELVCALKPKYWIMENIPRLKEFLSRKIPLYQFDRRLHNRFTIPQMKIFNSADFGVPQIRKRLICGRYPLPKQTHSKNARYGLNGNIIKKWEILSGVLRSLPNPFKGVEGAQWITDSNFPQIKILGSDLTAHFYDSYLMEEEVERAYKMKTDHSWYGQMAFPDEQNRPSRTIMATHSPSSREAIVIEDSINDEKVYRYLTVRECASLQSYPIIYQFLGTTLSSGHRLVGNSVPALLSQALAKAILIEEGLTPPEYPLSKTRVRPMRINLRRRKRRKNHFDLKRHFKDHIPNSKKGGFRIDVENVENNLDGGVMESKHLVKWITKLVIGSGKNYQEIIPNEEEIIQLLERAENSKYMENLIEKMLLSIVYNLLDQLPDGTTLQEVWNGRVKNKAWDPRSLLKRISSFVENNISQSISKKELQASDILHYDSKSMMPLDVFLYLLFTFIVCRNVNMSRRFTEPNDLNNH